MRESKNKVVFYPFLFALYPILFLYTHNIREVPILHILLPTALSLACAALVWYVIGRFVADKYKKGVILLLFLLIFFYYLDFHNLVNIILAKVNLSPTNHFVTVYLVLSFWVIGVYALNKCKRSFLKLSTVLNISISFLILFNLFSIFLFQINQVRSTAKLDKSQLSAVGSQSSGANNKNNPDIYYLIFDELASLSTMKKIFAYDNSKFARKLQERGFFVTSQSRTRYKTTERSLAASLNMEYIPMGENPFNLIRKNRATRFLKNQGYTIINFTHWAKGTLELSDKIYYYSKGKFSFLFTDFSKMLWEKSLLFSLYKGLMNKIDYHLFHQQRILYLMNELEKIPAVKGPKFIFAHIVSPHDPYVFDREGNQVDRKHHFNLKEKKYYLNQYIYMCKRIVRLVDAILAGSSEPPIIIIQSDHGFRGSAGGIQQVSAGNEWTRIFNAYFLPGVTRNVLYHSISPVNSFRLIFNLYFNQKMTLLPD